MDYRDFAQRLNAACDDLGTVPPHGQGRQVFFARKLKVSQEAVRKWFSGEARPRIRLLVELARILNVDPAWLSYGVDPIVNASEKRVLTKKAEGVVYLALGMSMLSGGSCARPGEDDPRKDFVDYYMISDGDQIAVHVALARPTEPGELEFALPREYEQVRNLGIVFAGSTKIHMLNLRRDVIDRHKEKRAGGWVLRVIQKASAYFAGKDEIERISGVGELV